jgi:hypothetical protein
VKTDPDPVRIQGPLELIDGHWLLRIPLAVGGQQLVPLTRGIAEVRDDVLVITLPENLVQNLGLREGQHLWVNSENGELSFEWEHDA